MHEIKSEDILVLDLDGTLVSYNTFHKWVFLLLKEGTPRHSLHIRITILKLLILRKLKLIDHAEMKGRLMEAVDLTFLDCEQGNSEQEKLFAKKIRRDFRSDLNSLIYQAKNRGVPCILATAAPINYAKHLNLDQIFDCVIATKITSNGIIDEARYERKRELVLQKMSDEGWEDRKIVFATDHIDDLPLCSIAHYTFWYGANEEWYEVSTSSNGEILGQPQL